MIVLGKVLFCNSFEIGHTKEAFILVFRFESPDGYKETVYVAISPAGVTVLNETLGKEITEYVKEHGSIAADVWKTQKNNNNSPQEAKPKYLS